MKQRYRKGMGRGYRGPLRPPRRKKPVAEPVHYPERPAVPLTAFEQAQAEKIATEIQAKRRQLDASDRIHKTD